MNALENIKVFLLDNFDSFTYNLVDELRGLGLELVIYRNSVDAQKIFQRMQAAAKSHQVLLLLSPGPGTPSDAGSLLPLLELVKGQFPVLGICLGHQAIVKSYGGDVVRANEVMHGKASYINHNGSSLFDNLPNPLPVARYHSLVASNTPAELQIIAQYQTVPMAVYHQDDNMLGFQFHPESILTSHGSQLLSQSIRFLTEKA
ncbi:aminodeoxychorismate/anthranilate synthase component II [Aliiglaciecola litoralis]|uniref:anthranilate synthase n=1 Tax=Aliiglaciecola litoralis TaxID=582857 RepID=A0ABN1LCR9_9ALTE